MIKFASGFTKITVPIKQKSISSLTKAHLPIVPLLHIKMSFICGLQRNQNFSASSLETKSLTEKSRSPSKTFFAVKRGIPSLIFLGEICSPSVIFKQTSNSSFFCQRGKPVVDRQSSVNLPEVAAASTDWRKRLSKGVMRASRSFRASTRASVVSSLSAMRRCSFSGAKGTSRFLISSIRIPLTVVPVPFDWIKSDFERQKYSIYVLLIPADGNNAFKS